MMGPDFSLEVEIPETTFYLLKRELDDDESVEGWLADPRNWDLHIEDRLMPKWGVG